MYGDIAGRPLTEKLPYAAHTRKGKVWAAMSEAALDYRVTLAADGHSS
jgi:hypothetical protein